MAGNKLSTRLMPTNPASPEPGTEPAPRRFTVDEYYKMAEAGILGPDERVELLRGEIFVMSPIGSFHGFCVDLLAKWLMRGLADRAEVRVQNPVRLGNDSEPEPDIAILRGPSTRYVVAHPRPEDVLLLTEVADTSFPFDRRRKLPEYAWAGIPEVWLFNLPRAQAHVFRGPQAGNYRRHSTFGRDASLTPAAFPDLTLVLGGLFNAIKP